MASDGAGFSGFTPLASFKAALGPTDSQGRPVKFGRMNIKISDGTVIEGVKVARFDPSSIKDKIFYTFNSAAWKPIKVGDQLMFVNYASFSKRVQRAVGFRQDFLDRIAFAKDSSKIFKQSIEALVQINKAKLPGSTPKDIQRFALSAIFRGVDSVVLPATDKRHAFNILITSKKTEQKGVTTEVLLLQQSPKGALGAHKAYTAFSCLTNESYELRKMSNSEYEAGFTDFKAFQKEMKYLQRLKNSPYVLKATHTVTTMGGPSIAPIRGAMFERCSGGEFKEIEKKRASLSREQKLKIAYELAKGLEDVHKAGIAFGALTQSKIAFAGKESGVRLHGFHDAQKADVNNTKDNVYSMGLLLLRLGISDKVNVQEQEQERKEATGVFQFQKPWEDVIDQEWVPALARGNPEERFIASMLQQDPSKRPSSEECAAFFLKHGG